MMESTSDAEFRWGPAGLSWIGHEAGPHAPGPMALAFADRAMTEVYTREVVLDHEGGAACIHLFTARRL